MKRTALLNRHLSHLIASLGHLDEIVVADAGLPVPEGVPVIDLAVTHGVPDFWQVVQAIRSELVIEQAVFAQEGSETLRQQMGTVVEKWEAEIGKPVSQVMMSHDAFKERTKLAKAIIRTGECTPYCNMILVSGVPF